MFLFLIVSKENVVSLKFIEAFRKKFHFFAERFVFLTDMSEPKVIVADDGDQVSLKLKDLIQGEADKVLKSSDTATLVIGLSGSMSS